MFIDTHAHLNFSEFEKELPKIIKNAAKNNIGAIINVGSNYKTSEKAVKIVKDDRAKAHEIDAKVARKKYIDRAKKIQIFAAVGCHPIHLADDITEEATFNGKEYKFRTKKEEFNTEKYDKLIKENIDIIKAIGETGLDFYHLDRAKAHEKKHESYAKNKIIQKEVFINHIKLANKYNLPLILHCRGSEEEPQETYNEMIKIIDRAKAPERKRKNQAKNGVIHCFTGNLKQAREFINRGFYIGVNGIVTFKKSIELQNIIKEIPLENIVLETDCPYLAPEPYRGKRNEPAYIPLIAQKIAQLKNISINKIEEQTTKNARVLFNI